MRRRRLFATVLSALTTLVTLLGGHTGGLSASLVEPLIAQFPTAEAAASPDGPTASATPTPSRPASPRPAPKTRAPQASRAIDNPFVTHPWANYLGAADPAWDPYVRATGTKKALLANIALTPKAKWFGDWITTRDIGARVREYVTNAQAGDPNALVQFTVFRMVPWEHDACARLPTKAESVAYRQWTDAFAAAIGSTPAAIVLQPDGPFALCAPGGSLKPSRLIAYSAKVFSALPNTSVYIEAGSADWPAPGQGGVPQVLKFLVPAGIAYARGFALNGTHYSSTADEVRRGAAISQALAAAGYPDKKFVVNTSSNGHPFLFGTYQGPDPDNAWVCKAPTDTRTCVMLGIPPTHQVANPEWGLPADVNALALQYADAYLWFGRPWLNRQNYPFVMGRALTLARTWRWAR